MKPTVLYQAQTYQVFCFPHPRSESPGSSRSLFITAMQPRVRFNAKARQGGSHKKKKTHRPKDRPDGPEEQMDPNATIVVPKSDAEKEQERKLKMREEVRLHDFCQSRVQLRTCRDRC